MPAKRDWTAARQKCEEEGRCRACGLAVRLEAAHLIPRSRIKPGPAENPLNICPLCARCHRAFDEGSLDISTVLTNEEASYAVLLVGLEEARRRLTNQRTAA